MAYTTKERLKTKHLYYSRFIIEEDLKIAYKKILEKCEDQIVKEYKREKQSMVFTVPLKKKKIKKYNVLNCCIYLIDELRAGDFYIRYAKPNYLWIDLTDTAQEKENVRKLLFLAYEDQRTQLLLNKYKTLASSVDNSHKNDNEFINNKLFNEENALKMMENTFKNNPQLLLEYNIAVEDTYKNDPNQEISLKNKESSTKEPEPSTIEKARITREQESSTKKQLPARPQEKASASTEKKSSTELISSTDNGILDRPYVFGMRNYDSINKRTSYNKRDTYINSRQFDNLVINKRDLEYRDREYRDRGYHNQIFNTKKRNKDINKDINENVNFEYYKG